MSKFKELALIEPLIENLGRLGYDHPTAIQTEAIPSILKGSDLLGIAQTGTGKSAAFCLPILQKLSIDNRSGTLRALILVPTRELALQLEESFVKYGGGMGLTTLTVFGGVDQKSQVEALRRGIDILVATPGRLLDLMGQGHVRLAKIQAFVLDEADRMLDMGFIDDLNLIIEKLPHERQTLFFSATMPDDVAAWARKILKRPVQVEVHPESSTVAKLEQKVIFCKREDKFQLLKKILKNENFESVVVFTTKKDSADRVKEYLRFHKIAAAIIHGDKSQQDREKALSYFKQGSMKILIATDVAARGIDVQGIDCVINFELPLSSESYVHRVGRTARAGRDGTAISFCDDSEREKLKSIEAHIEKSLPWENYKGTPEASGKWNHAPAVRRVTAPTPGRSQEKTAYLDHSKRQGAPGSGATVAKRHPGFRGKKKK